MMKIHTTQNLTPSTKFLSTNMLMSKRVRNAESSESCSQLNPECSQDSFMRIAFKGKKKILDKVVKSGKKKFGERVANRSKKMLDSDSFGSALKFTQEQEVMISSISSLGICCIARPATIMALPGDGKKDCAYASAHSFSSGAWGFAVSLLAIKPLTNGYNEALKNIHKYVKNDEVIKRLWSHVDIKSTKDASGKFKPMSEWIDLQGNKFIKDIKDVRKIPQPKHISEISEATLKEKFAGLDLSKIENVSPNKWVTTEGKKAKMNLEDIYIAVEEIVEKEGKKPETTTKYYPLMHLDDKLFKELYPEVDFASTIGKDGRRLHPENWKKASDNNAYEFNYDNIFISDWKETDSAIPLITGKTRKEGKKFKDVCYQKNNNEKNPWSLGTEITQKMVEDSYIMSVLDKFGGWFPDILVAYPRATATIAIIPFVLQNILGMEKYKKPKVEASGKEVA